MRRLLAILCLDRAVAVVGGFADTAQAWCGEVLWRLGLRLRGCSTCGYGGCSTAVTAVAAPAVTAVAAPALQRCSTCGYSVAAPAATQTTV